MEKGATGAPTFPVKVALEVARLVMAKVRSEKWATATLPELTDEGVMDMLIVGTALATFTVPTIPDEQWGMQKYGKLPGVLKEN